MSIKNDRVDFEKLLNGIDPVEPAVDNKTAGSASASSGGKSSGQEQAAAVVDTASSAELMETKLFEFKYDEEKKGIRKKCRKTVLAIVGHIVPDDMINDPYVQDKVEQDVETLTGLYMQAKSNEVMQRSILEQVSKGIVSARMYEVFGQLTDKLQAINKQIVDTEQKLRKTYVDLKFEIQTAREESAPKTMMVNGPVQNNGGGVFISSTKSLIEEARKAKKDAYLNAKETKVEVIE